MKEREYTQSYAVFEPNPQSLERLEFLLADWQGWRCVAKSRALNTQSDWLDLQPDVVFVSVEEGFEALDWALACPQWLTVAMVRGRKHAWELLTRGVQGVLEKPFRVGDCQQLCARLERRVGREQFIWLEVGSTRVKVPTQDVLWARVQGRGTQVAWAAGTGSASEAVTHLVSRMPHLLPVRRGLWVAPAAVTAWQAQGELDVKWLGQRVQAARRQWPALRRNLARL